MRLCVSPVCMGYYWLNIHVLVQILDPATVPDSIVPTAVERKVRQTVYIGLFKNIYLLHHFLHHQGNYAFAVTWSDGHTSSLYTYDALTALIAEYTSKSADQQ